MSTLFAWLHCMVGRNILLQLLHTAYL